MSFHVRGRHAYITGGGGGLGLAMANELVILGANISLVTKDLVKIVPVVNSLKAARLDESQTIVAISADLSDYEESKRAFEEAIQLQNGQVPDWVILCAGFAPPGRFLDMDKEALHRAFQTVYLVHANTTLISAKASIGIGKPGNIVMTSSILARESWAGYGGVAPARYALRALYDTLKSELMPNDIRIYFATFSGQFGDAFDQEAFSKSGITRQQDKRRSYSKLDAATEARKLVHVNSGDTTDLDFRIATGDLTMQS